MDAADGRRSAGSSTGWDAATVLATRLASGDRLPVLPSPMPLRADEALHAAVAVEAFRYCSLEVPWVRQRAIAFGGPVLCGVAVGAVARQNRRARRNAAAASVPQWHALGQVEILVTSHRLVVGHRGEWASVWYEAIAELRPDLSHGRLQLAFRSDPPYALRGDWVPYLSVVVAAALVDRVGPGAVAALVTA